ncbi:hypothetical protein F751_0788 [Auxenochlorella protothecoides]|uniref:Uncharacterized protein n=1 Tax=Auxenochlorella protothecoides TaxID=3075 RepID=A0A087SS10_AUXPR|nr:hypothetical protein F751_0788 [Auxenochlorella protothecoides]KFM28514.1 hypothetical protein F751_0788 [Auxenochlorella protothecoides]
MPGWFRGNGSRRLKPQMNSEPRPMSRGMVKPCNMIPMRPPMRREIIKSVQRCASQRASIEDFAVLGKVRQLPRACRATSTSNSSWYSTQAH